MSPKLSGEGTISFRTCVACRVKKSRRELWRFALDGSFLVVADLSGRYEGRHVYCCRKDGCLRIFLKKHKEISRCFRRQVLGFGEELQSLFGSER